MPNNIVLPVQPAQVQPFISVMDEFGYYVGSINDGLKRALREIDGVPNASYLVQGDKVFVFDKLVDLARQAHRVIDAVGRPDADKVLALLPQAYVSFEEAVDKWGIVPYPYEVSEKRGALSILHKPFGARLPVDFPTEDAARSALLALLRGEVYPGEGDFSYCGQPLSLCAPLSLDLPGEPTFSTPIDEGIHAFGILSSTSFLPGFAPVTEALFHQAQEREKRWRIARKSTILNLRKNAESLWRMTGSLPLASFNNSEDFIPEWAVEESRALKEMYPELGMLSEASLYDQYASYQSEYGLLDNSWIPTREVDFLAYLLGKLCNPTLTGWDAHEEGLYIAIGLLEGRDLDSAHTLAIACRTFNDAIGALTRRISSAMHYLKREQTATDRRGEEALTFMDVFSKARSFGFTANIAQTVQNNC